MSSSEQGIKISKEKDFQRVEVLQSDAPEELKMQVIAEMFSDYYTNVRGYAYSIVHSYEAAEDIAQKVFIKLITKIDRFYFQDVTFFSWLMRVTHNAAIDHLRESPNRHLAYVESVDSLPEPSIHADYDIGADPADMIKDDSAALRMVFGGLSARYRQVVYNRAILELTSDETAQAMGITQSAVYGIYNRARVEARRALANSREVSSPETSMEEPEELAA